MKLINKSEVAEEIEKRIEEGEKVAKELPSSAIMGLVQAYKNILSFLDTLEVKEEVLDRNDKTKLMRKCVKTAYKRGYDMGVLQTTNKVNHNTKEVDLWRKKISNSLTEEGLFTFEDGSQAIITKTN